jgi:glycolate oxidase
MDKELYRELEKIVGERCVSDEDADRICHSYDATKQRAVPDVVIKPNSAQEVSEILKLANKKRITRRNRAGYDPNEQGNRDRYGKSHRHS